MAYQQRPRCDTYFVEDSGCTARPHPRDIAKIVARQRQEQMANELSRQAADEYLDDILRQMKEMENATVPDVASIDVQQEIEWFMRPYLLDFLMEAHSFFQLMPETLFLAINLLDRYCSKRVVYKRHYQLVGCAALLIAAKYGDRKDRVPTIRELKSMCCSLYDEEMFTQMEWHVLNTLDWVIGHPTVDSFLQIALAESAFDDSEAQHMSWFICEIAMYHREFVAVKPSVMARTSLALARSILGRPDIIDMDMEHEDNVTLLCLSQYLYQPSQVLSKKYSQPQLSSVSSTMETFLANQAAIARRATPLTPPVEQPKQVVNNYVYNTPQKVPHGVIVNGYLTPPITPEGELQYFFADGDGAKRYVVQPELRSTTPTPSYQHQYAGHSHWQTSVQ